MLTAWCLLVELVSQFLLTINPGVHRFLVEAACAYICTSVCVRACTPAAAITASQPETHFCAQSCRPCWHGRVPLGHLGSGDLSYSRAVDAWTTGLGKWLRCCIVVNKIPCYLTRPSNRAGSNAFSSWVSFCSSEAGSMEQSCWYASTGAAQTSKTERGITCLFNSGQCGGTYW